MHQLHNLCLGVRLGVVGVHAVDVAEQDEQVGAPENRRLGAQVVVVADAELLDRNRVVLVYDRHHALVHQREERVADIERAVVVLKVVAREQKLPDVDAVLVERLSPAVDKLHLPDGAERLPVMDVLAPSPAADGAKPAHLCARRHDDNLLSLRDERGAGGSEVVQKVVVYGAVRLCERVRADFDDDFARGGDSVFYGDVLRVCHECILSGYGSRKRAFVKVARSGVHGECGASVTLRYGVARL